MLLIDDDAAVRVAVQAVLVGRGVRVILAAQGPEALDIFRQRATEIDIVVLDIRMPQMDGGQVLRELRVIQPDVRVVISTGGPWDVADPLLDGCNRLAFACKSQGPQELIAQLERLLGRKLQPTNQQPDA